MKQLIVGGLVFGFCLSGLAQSGESEDSQIVNLPETVVSESLDTITLKPITPSYPREMALKCMTGYVVADVTVNGSGRVTEVDLQSSTQPAFADAAEEALWNWTFVPAEQDRRHFVIPIRFGLPGMPDAVRPEDRAEVIVMATLESQVVFSEMPAYPPELCRHAKGGQVMLDVAVNQEGRVEDVTVLQADDPKFAEAAEKALRKWTFVASEQPLPGGVRHIRVPMKFMLAGR